MSLSHTNTATAEHNVYYPDDHDNWWYYRHILIHTHYRLKVLPHCQAGSSYLNLWGRHRSACKRCSFVWCTMSRVRNIFSL